MTIMTPATFAFADAADLYGALMDGAADAGDPDGHVFACVLAARARDCADPLDDAVGLEPAELDRLLVRHFPGVSPDGPVMAYLTARRGRRTGAGVADFVMAEEVADLRLLLTDHITAPVEEAGWLASMVARACLFSNHLWQDLGLASRKDLSGLLTRHFEPLASKNTADMKWKKFFYKQLCDREGLNLCKAPSCGVCTDFKLCFGPEE
ncbi:nitrogen fixation protein NifQ [Skermanella stibiiresistens SB22]|uniref:Nitrogen fixation protein NifQ n=1 Tax=Skermanella stibiiresistens SB22 TaxID=1385369 RepID=W9H054_9PROT|nr:nitrogen fixation protein NifQ [Skermanella stibiiresistens]EWY39454.1 nitrogen fixation protein NifQ [Skermanella stibiiresistens SB22]